MIRSKEEIKNASGLPEGPNAHAEMIALLEQIREELVKLNAK